MWSSSHDPRPLPTEDRPAPAARYSGLVEGIRELLDAARHSSARAVNALMTATYWEMVGRIVEYEQRGAKRAATAKNS